MFKLFRMKAHGALALASILFLATFVTNSLASTFYTSFTVGGFPSSNGDAAPNDPVSGTILWAAPDIHSDIQSFVSISLTLDGHNYSVSELSYFRLGSPTTWNGVGGTIDGPSAVENLTDDFFITWDSASLQPVEFFYSSSKRSGIWSANTVHNPNAFQSFTVAAVPEPGSLSLLSFGLLGLLARRVRVRIKCPICRPAFLLKFKLQTTGD
jgi:hypothetical protein